jgi:phosphoadenosine phosphosulfate reductase
MSTASASELEQRSNIAQEFLRQRLIRAQQPCITSSFQAEDVVVLDMVRAILPRIPVLFLETGYHFPETLVYRDRMAAEWDLNLINVLPQHTVAEQESEFGILYQSAPDRCCGLRKVEPLFRSLAPYDTWVTGLRREQSKSRANLQAEESFALPTGHVLSKLSPLA